MPQNGARGAQGRTKGDLQMLLPTPTSKGVKGEGESGVLLPEKSGSPWSGFHYHQQPFLLLLLLFPSWKKAGEQAGRQAGSSPGERLHRAAGRGADNGGVIHYKGTGTATHGHARRLQPRCRCRRPPHGLAGLLKEAAAPFPLREMLDTFPPSPSPDGKQIRRKTPARHWAVQEREGFVLHASQQAPRAQRKPFTV